MPESEQSTAVARAYRTINEADPNVRVQADRLRRLYKQLGEDPKVGERAIDGMLESGPGAAARLQGTADAVIRLHKIKED